MREYDLEEILAEYAEDNIETALPEEEDILKEEEFTEPAAGLPYAEETALPEENEAETARSDDAEPPEESAEDPDAQLTRVFRAPKPEQTENRRVRRENGSRREAAVQDEEAEEDAEEVEEEAPRTAEEIQADIEEKTEEKTEERELWKKARVRDAEPDLHGDFPRRAGLDPAERAPGYQQDDRIRPKPRQHQSGLAAGYGTQQRQGQRPERHRLHSEALYHPRGRDRGAETPGVRLRQRHTGERGNRDGCDPAGERFRPAGRAGRDFQSEP